MPPVIRKQWFVSPLGLDANTGLDWDNAFLTVTFALTQMVASLPHQLNLGMGAYNETVVFPDLDLIINGTRSSFIDGVPYYDAEQGENAPGIVLGDGVTTVFFIKDLSVLNSLLELVLVKADVTSDATDNPVYLKVVDSGEIFSGDGDEVKLNRSARTFEFETAPVDGSLITYESLRGPFEYAKFSKSGSVVFADVPVNIRNVKSGAVNKIVFPLEHLPTKQIAYYFTYDASGNLIDSTPVIELV
ncbi:hypothetical protein LCGC14_0147570 [marine sediment metagenome]|uniref:Uncharacterized protein n=1 Tax=marine sediment metagenome TaxID=412755 RepID=A0A0F9V093_9ZZZZ